MIVFFIFFFPQKKKIAQISNVPYSLILPPNHEQHQPPVLVEEQRLMLPPSHEQQQPPELVEEQRQQKKEKGRRLSSAKIVAVSSVYFKFVKLPEDSMNQAALALCNDVSSSLGQPS